MKSSLLILSVVVHLINFELKLSPLILNDRHQLVDDVSSLILDDRHQLVDDVGSHGLELCVHM